MMQFNPTLKALRLLKVPKGPGPRPAIVKEGDATYRVSYSKELKYTPGVHAGLDGTVDDFDGFWSFPIETKTLISSIVRRA